MIEITIEDHLPVKIPDQRFIEHLTLIFGSILQDMNQENRDCSVFICGDELIQTLNKEYRGKDYATDVLSFALDEGDDFPKIDNAPLGDIIISAEQALKQAEEYSVSYEEELARLGIHGLLHLLGFDHENSEEAHTKMFAIQDKFMDEFMKSYAGTRSSHI